MTFAKRVSSLRSEGAYQVLAAAQQLEAQGREIIHLEIGQPDFDTFPHIRQAGIRAIENRKTKYNPPAGVPELREAVARYASTRIGVDFTPSQVVISPGAKLNLLLPTLALVEEGDEVIYPDPGFPSYPEIIRIAGGVPVPVPLLEQNHFSFDMKTFEARISAKTKIIILNSPGNPTGGIMPREDLEGIASMAEEYGVWIMSDEIYSRMVYDGAHAPSIASLPGMHERTIVVDGFSKTYAMTGWRLGYGVMPADLAERVALLLTHSIGCTAHFTQYAGLEALTGSQEEVEQAVTEYQSRRDFIVRGLNRLPGFRCETPGGAFYAFPNITQTGFDSRELASRLLHEAGVALLPGRAFGEFGEGYLRISYAADIPRLELALERMGDCLTAWMK
jgi:aspartate aminotransferase